MHWPISREDSYLLAIYFLVNLGQRRWYGQKLRTALKDALAVELAAASKSVITNAVAAPLLRAQAARSFTIVISGSLKGFSRTLLGKAAINRIATVSLGKSVHGAAALSCFSKLLRSNVIISVVTLVGLTMPDLYRAAWTGSITWKQFSRNLLVNVASLTAGVSGWMAGAALGSALGSAVPGLGTVLGGVLGGLIGTVAGDRCGSAAARSLWNKLFGSDT